MLHILKRENCKSCKTKKRTKEIIQYFATFQPINCTTTIRVVLCLTWLQNAGVASSSTNKGQITQICHNHSL